MALIDELPFGKYWGLACRRCRLGVKLGKLVTMDDDGLPLPPHFGGYWHRGVAIGDDQLRRLIELFLIEHHGHHLAVIESDVVLDLNSRLEEDGLPHALTWLANPDELVGIYNEETSLDATRDYITEWEAEIRGSTDTSP
jgi:hypothetical protein